MIDTLVPPQKRADTSGSIAMGIKLRNKLLTFLIFWHYFVRMFSNIGLEGLIDTTCS